MFQAPVTAALATKATKNKKKIVNSEELILQIARQTIDIEVDTLQALRSCLDGDFVSAVVAIAGCKGRLVITGIGKSAIVAQKIVATLNSTGTPALFLHAADAIHGDLGMIQPDDIVLCISKSGETAEIRVLVPLLRGLGNVLLAMVSNRNSYLGRRAAYLLHTPVAQEADPNNLAPTASTTAQMAMGDALATALLALKGFSPRDFAQFHPGGALGKQLYLRVHDIYPQNEQPRVSPVAGLRTTILEMTSKRLGATAVVDEQDRVLGIITDGDLRRMLENNSDTSGLTARDLMTTAPKRVQPDELAIKALETMRKNSITQLIVADKSGRYLGFIHLHDLIREGLI